jgi:hypothetical protein
VAKKNNPIKIRTYFVVKPLMKWYMMARPKMTAPVVSAKEIN